MYLLAASFVYFHLEMHLGMSGMLWKQPSLTEVADSCCETKILDKLVSVASLYPDFHLVTMAGNIKLSFRSQLPQLSMEHLSYTVIKEIVQRHPNPYFMATERICPLLIYPFPLWWVDSVPQSRKSAHLEYIILSLNSPSETPQLFIHVLLLIRNTVTWVILWSRD